MNAAAAYLLLILGGKKNPSSDDIKGVFESIGVQGDDTSINNLISDLEGKDIAQLIEEGTKKIANVSLSSGSSTTWAWRGRFKSAWMPAWI